MAKKPVEWQGNEYSVETFKSAVRRKASTKVRITGNLKEYRGSGSFKIGIPKIKGEISLGIIFRDPQDEPLTCLCMAKNKEEEEDIQHHLSAQIGEHIVLSSSKFDVYGTIVLGDEYLIMEKKIILVDRVGPTVGLIKKVKGEGFPLTLEDTANNKGKDAAMAESYTVDPFR